MNVDIQKQRLMEKMANIKAAINGETPRYPTFSNKGVLMAKDKNKKGKRPAIKASRNRPVSSRRALKSRGCGGCSRSKNK